MSEILSPQTLAELQHPHWTRRNSAIKQVSKIKSPASIEALINFIKDRRPAPFWRRLLGEKYYQVGFCRRNAWLALREQDIQLKHILPILDIGFEDDYYEVPTATWTTLGSALKKGKSDCTPEVVDALKNRLLKEDNFEVLMAALSTADLIFPASELLEISHSIQVFKHWRIRAAYLECLGRCVKAGLLKPEAVEKKLCEFNMRSEYFRPIFMLKEKGAELEQLIKTSP
jgi:HEAT repeat protein